MFQKDYIPTWLTLFLATGILIEYHFPVEMVFVLSTAVVLFIMLIFSHFYNRKKLIPSVNFFIISMLFFVLIGITSVKIKTVNHNDETGNYGKEQKIVFRIEKILKESAFYQSFEAKIIEINGKKTKEKVLVNFLKDSAERKIPDVNDIFYTSAVLEKISPPLNPYQFDYRNYLKTKQIFYRLRLKPEEVLQLDTRKITLKGISHRIRKKIDTALKKYNFSEEELSVINALLLGQRQNIDKELFEDYKNAGAVHILAISGLHIGILLFLLNFLLKPVEYFKNGKLIKLILIVILLWSFAFLAGLSASVVRAVSMFTAIAIGLFSKRKLSLVNALILSMFFLLLFHPFYLFDAGFQLSYLAVFFIITLQPFLVQLWHPGSKFVNYFWQLFTVSVSAQTGVLPLSLYYFHQFPGLFFVSGMVIIPFLGLILGLGLLVIFLAVIHILPDLMAEFYGSMIGLMNRFITFVSDQEMFIFYEISFSVILMLLFYAAFFFGLKLMIKQNFRNILCFLSAIILIQTYMIYKKNEVQNSSEFIVFNSYKKMLIGHRKGRTLNIYSALPKEEIKKNRIIKDYKTGKGNIDSLRWNEIKNFYNAGLKRIMLVDSTGVYIDDFRPDIVILTENPKINFERLLFVLHPETVITDWNNYRYLSDKWKETSEKHQVKFYRTSQKGAFMYYY
jgi:competence protein ComEC